MMENDGLLSVMPHRGRMLLISRVISYNLEEKCIEAEYHITEDCLFYDSAMTGVPSWVGFEFIAQSVSAYAGIRNRERGIPPKTGFVLTVSGLKMELPFFKAGNIITIKSKEIENIHPISVFEGEIFLDGKKVLEGKLKLMDVDDEKAFM